MTTHASPSGTLVKNDWKKIGVGSLLALAGCALSVVTDTVSDVDLGSWSAPIAAGWAIALNIFRKWLPAR